MDTKQKNRRAKTSAKPQPGAAKRSAPAGEKKKSAARKQKAPQQAQRSAVRQQARPTAEQEQQRRARQAQLRAQQQAQAARQPVADAPEEVYRPAPSRERHRQPEQREQPRARSSQESAATHKPRPAQKAARSRRSFRQSKNAAPVIYTQPARFNLNRLLIQLLTITAVVLALTMCLSIFFKVEVITVSGADVYSEWSIREASGIEEGDSLLTFSRARAGAKIRAELPYVESVRFGIKLPNTVIIDIEELEVVYAIQANDGLWWLITSNGRVVEQTDSGTASNYTKILGVTLASPSANEDAVAYETYTAQSAEATGATEGTGTTEATTPPVTTTNADRLAIALQIIHELEENDVVGEVASVNVSNLSSITLWYGTRYEVKLGSTDKLDYKITSMRDAIGQMSEYQMGVLDVTFSIWEDKVVFTPFED